MAASRDKSNDRTRGVQFTKESAQAIADTVRIVGHGDRRMSAMSGSFDARSASHYLSKTTATWNKGTSQTLNLWAGTPGSESQLSDQVIAWNKFANVASGKWVMLARANGTFYLIAAEC